MKQIILILFLMVSCIACNQEETVSPDHSGNTITFSLKNSIDEIAINSRAQGEDSRNENKIDRLDIFFFDASDVCLFYPATSQISQTGTSVTVTIPESSAGTLFGKNIKLYVLANCELTRDQLSGKSRPELQKLVQENTVTLNPAPYQNQDNFLMDGQTTFTALSDDLPSSLGTVELKRAAAKVTVRITSAQIEGYQAVEGLVRINNYLDKTALGNEAGFYTPQANDLKHASFRSIFVPGTGTSFDTDPFYSYSNDWSTDASKESYITIAIKWQRISDGYQRYYYYRVPFNYIPQNPGDDFRYRVRRNYIYNFSVDVSVLGGLDPEEMIDLSPNFEIRDWTTNNIEVILNRYDFLVVSEKDVIIHDITTKAIKYQSSQPIEILNAKAYYPQYQSTGDIDTIYYTSTDPIFPKFNIYTDKSIIETVSPVPVNYVPVTIEFTVRNDAGLTQNVRIVQYPRQYITSSYSSGVNLSDPPFGSWTNNGNGRPNMGMTNFNFYTVTTTSLALEDPFVLGVNLEQMPANDDWIPGAYVTKLDENSNKMISPKFIIASQRGITSINTPYSQAQRRCATYSEAQYAKGTWRMPTQAEMMLISKLQVDNNSAIKGLFTNGEIGETWWTARQDIISAYYIIFYSVYMTTNTLNSQVWTEGSTPTHSVRCVRDVWKDE